MNLRPAVAVLAASLSVLAGSLGVARAASTPSGTVTVALNSDAVCLDPYESSDNNDIAIDGNIYEGLIGFNGKGKIVAQLATSWTVASNAESVTFDLNPSAKFSDGTPVNAQAVKASFAWLFNPANKSPRAFLFPAVKAIDVVNAETVRFVLAHPFGAIASVFASPAGKVIEKSALAKGEPYLCSHPIGGSGPFVFQQWVPGDFLTVTRSPDYWNPSGAAKVASITYKPVTDSSTAISGLETGQYQVVLPIPGQLAKTVGAYPGVKLHSGPSSLLNYVELNNTYGPFKKLLVRQALNYAIDSPAIISALWSGYGAPVHSPVPPGVSFAIDAGSYAYNPAKAKALLKKAGYPHGFTTTLWCSNNSTTVELATAIQQQLAAVGVTVHVEPMDAASLNAARHAANVQSELQMDLTGWGTSTFDADWQIRPLLASTSFLPTLNNGAFFASKQLDELLTDGLDSGVTATRAAAYTKAQKLVWHQAPWIFLPYQTDLWATASSVKGVVVRPDGVLLDNQVSG